MSQADQPPSNVNEQGEEQYQPPKFWAIYHYITQCFSYMLVGQPKPQDKPPSHYDGKQRRRNEVQRTRSVAPLEQQPTYIDNKQRGYIGERFIWQHNGFDQIGIDINPEEYKQRWTPIVGQLGGVC